MADMQQRLTIITLGVTDLKIATDFYENKFGWKKLASSTEDITFFQLNGILLSLYTREKLAEDAGVNAAGQGFKGFSLAYNTSSKEEVDQIVADLEKKGVPIVKKPQSVFWGGYSSYVADPDGHLWEIAFNPYLPMDEKGNVIDG
jgi:catechol 2,3-dioxygenase-like lactoylglutathione lyase family enzyme